MAAVFPYVIGTDITLLSRWSLRNEPLRVLKRIPRFLNGHEIRNLAEKNPALYKVIRPALYSSTQLDVSDRAGSAKSGDSLEELVASDEYQALLTPLLCSQISQYLGGRWAAKEAARKAWGADILGPKDLFLGLHPLQDPNPSNTGTSTRLSNMRAAGQPMILCQPFSTKVPVKDERVGQLSISHDGDYAIATVIAAPLEDDLVERLLERKRSLQTPSYIGRNNHTGAISTDEVSDEVEERSSD